MDTIGKLLFGFVALIIGAVLIVQVATTEQGVTTTKGITTEAHALTCAAGGNVTAETLTVTNAPTGWKTTDCPITSFVLKNSTGSTVTLTTDYTLDAAAGTYTLKDTAANNLAFCGGTAAQNTSYVDYKYCGDDYLNSTFGRSVLDMVGGFFAIALLLVAVGLFYSVAREAGIVN